MTRKDAATQSRKPLRSVPWWVLTALVLVTIGGVWAGTRWGGPIESGLANLAALVGRGDAVTDDAEHEGESEQIQYYTCGMHPSVILPEPGECPICHMDLTPLDASKFTGEVTIDPVVVQNIGVRIGAVVEGPLVRTIRTVGTVEYDETRVRDVNTKLSGWIETLYVDYVGAPVEAGDPLFEVYSPALLAAEEEFLLALRARAANGDRPGAIDLVGSSRAKLALFDITPEQIDALETSGEASRTMTVRSPHSGVVIAKHANEGMRIDPGMQVFRIADLSKVWALVTLYESQLPFVSLGQTAVMSLSYIPGQTFEGRVVYIYPYVDTQTREVQVRLEFDNPGGLLKPGMFTTVELHSTLRQRAVLAPREAVISTGARNVAFVSMGEGKFEPREVRLGVETGAGEVEILDGLEPGELVVTSGQFLLDSESRVREALAKMIRGEMASDQVVQAVSAGGAELASMPEAMSAGLTAMLDAYFEIGDRLSNDSPAGLDEPSRAVAAALDSVIGIDIPGNEHFWHEHTEAASARGSALELIGVADIVIVREHFADLSVAIDTLVRATGIPPGYSSPVQSVHCPMFREGQGGSTWLQPEGPVRNPFMGLMMPRCFDSRETIPFTGEAAGPLTDDPVAESSAQDPLASTITVTRAMQGALNRAAEAYLQAQRYLTLNEPAEAADAFASLRSSVAPLRDEIGVVGASTSAIETALTDLPAELEAQREAFGVTSDAMLAMLAVVPPSSGEDEGLFHAYCPMVEQNWLQVGDAIRNPYDPDMLTCGSIEGRIEPHGGLAEEPGGDTEISTDPVPDHVNSAEGER